MTSIINAIVNSIYDTSIYDTSIYGTSIYDTYVIAITLFGVVSIANLTDRP